MTVRELIKELHEQGVSLESPVRIQIEQVNSQITIERRSTGISGVCLGGSEEGLLIIARENNKGILPLEG